MARDRTARTRIRQYLTTSGPLEDGSGHATSALKDAIDYQGSPVAFIQLIAAMDRDGEIVREIRGKRTYRISPSEELVAAAAPAPRAANGTVLGAGQVAVEIDYDKLARALVRELLSVAAGTDSDDRVAAERNEYARRLEVARDKLDELLAGSVDLPAEVAEESIVATS